MYSVYLYGQMIADSIRRDAYAAALERVVRPGAVVLELGTGTGYFGLLACKLGARRVIAVEPDPVIQLAREIASANGLTSRIEFVQQLSTQISLDEPADVLVSDMRGILPLLGRHIPSIADARERLLKPGGAILAARDELWAALVEAPALYASYVEPWTESPLDFDMEAARWCAVNGLRKVNLKREHLFALPQRWALLDYYEIVNADVSGSLEWTAERAGSVCGIDVWFDTTLVDEIGFSNAPGTPELIYGSLFLPLTKEVALSAGDQVEVDLSANLVHDEYVWRWETRISRGGAVVTRFVQSSFFGAPLTSETVARRSSRFVPRLSPEGETYSVILRLMRGGATLEEIAREVAREFPSRFPDWRDAMTKVSEASAKYGV